jgi:branched-chain amino acid transport system substrate-binding protein
MLSVICMKRAQSRYLEQYPDIEYHIVYSPVDTKDMTPYIIQVRDLNPDIVVMGHWGADAITAIKQVHEMGLKDETDIFFLWIISVFAKAIEPEALEGIKLQTFWHHDMTGFADQEIVDSTNELVQSWVDRIGEPPDALGSFCLDRYSGNIPWNSISR